jgi:predicted SprT family Zn-dependent metalloprotease
MQDTITTKAYMSLSKAYDYFNKELFDSRLPECIITLQRKPKMHGYFWGKKYVSREGNETFTDELALNPSMFDQSEQYILSVLVHEMVHVWQAHFGKNQSRGGYHNMEWAEAMLAIGLHPTDDGTLNGKMTGQKLSHLVVPGDLFEVFCTKLLSENTVIEWADRPVAEPEKKKRNTRHKYLCPSCAAAVWAKPGLKITCDDCEEHYVDTDSEDGDEEIRLHNLDRDEDEESDED